jgi:hypothetical protein
MRGSLPVRTEYLHAGADLPSAMSDANELLHEALRQIQRRASTGSSNRAIQRDLRLLLACELKDREVRTQLLLDTVLLLGRALKSNGAHAKLVSAHRALTTTRCQRLGSK